MAQANTQLLQQYKAGKNAEQQKVIDYFCKEEGCISKNMTDEDEVSEISPAVFEGYVFRNAFAKKRANGNW